MQHILDEHMEDIAQLIRLLETPAMLIVAVILYKIYKSGNNGNSKTA